MARSYDVERVREDFPILKRKVHGKLLVYLDSAATSMKPALVIKTIEDFYKTSNANIHRGLHTLSEEENKKNKRTQKNNSGFYIKEENKQGDKKPCYFNNKIGIKKNVFGEYLPAFFFPIYDPFALPLRLAYED